MGRPSPAASAAAARRVEASLVVGRDRLGRAEAEVAQRQVDGVVPLRADEHPHAGRADQPAARDVPAGAAQHLVAGGGEAGEVGHRAAGDEADGAARRQPEQVEHPRLGDVLDGGVGRGERAQAGVLVPRADQPVGGQRRGVGAADDEAEEPPDGIAVSPGSQAAASRSTTSAGSVGPSGRPRRAARPPRLSAGAAPGGRRGSRATPARGRGRGRGRRCGVHPVSVRLGYRRPGDCSSLGCE